MWEKVEEPDGTIYYWNTVNGQCISKRPSIKKKAVEIKSDWKLVEEADGTIYYWNTVNGQCIPKNVSDLIS